MRRLGVRVLVFALWLLTALVGLWEVRALHQLFGWAYAHLVLHGAADRRIGEALGQVLLIGLALSYLAFTIITAEFHRAHWGKPASWRVFGATLLAQGMIALLTFATGTHV